MLKIFMKKKKMHSPGMYTDSWLHNWDLVKLVLAVLLRIFFIITYIYNLKTKWYPTIQNTRGHANIETLKKSISQLLYFYNYLSIITNKKLCRRLLCIFWDTLVFYSYSYSLVALLGSNESLTNIYSRLLNRTLHF